MHPLHTLLNNQPVQWKTLGEVADYEQPTQYLVSSKDYSDDYPTPVLTAGKTFILGYTDETHGIYNASQKPVIIFDDFTTANKWVDFDFKVKSSAMKMLTSKDESQVLLKFIYYYLNSLPSVEISDHKRQWISNFAQKRFPLPPLPLQARIVEILDNFTACIDTLNKEHTLRKKQYAHYRDLLLSEAELSKVGFEWKTLGEVVHSIKTGLNPRQFFQLNTPDAENYYVTIRELQNHNIVFSDKTDRLNDEALRLCNNRSNLEAGDILFSGTGTIGTVALVAETPKNWNIKEGVYTIKPIQDKILSKFLLYLFGCDTVKRDFLSRAAGGTVQSVPMKELAQVKIPLPPLPHQRKIVEILDRFDTLTNSITQGLPREIELRRKQYEYYRELLLTFE